MSAPTASQWREAASALREHAVKWERLARDAEEDAICGVVSLSGPNGEPLACGYSLGHTDAHSWSTLPTFPMSDSRFSIEVDSQGRYAWVCDVCGWAGIGCDTLSVASKEAEEHLEREHVCSRGTRGE